MLITQKYMLSSSDFDFTFKGRGAYEITYTTPRRGDYWRAYITDMELVDDTLHEEEPTQAAWKRLRAKVKCSGTRYSKYGERIEATLRFHHYLVKCQDGVNAIERTAYAMDRWDAERQVMKAFLETYGNMPAEKVSKIISAADAAAYNERREEKKK